MRETRMTRDTRREEEKEYSAKCKLIDENKKKPRALNVSQVLIMHTTSSKKRRTLQHGPPLLRGDKIKNSENIHWRSHDTGVYARQLTAICELYRK